MADFKNVFKSKKFKYGSYSVIFICVFVALVIAVNLVVSVIDDKFDLRYDITEEQFYSLSAETDQALKIALGNRYSDFDITITFCAEKDMFEYYDGAKTEVSKYYSGVRDVAEEYAALYDGSNGKGKVTVEYVNITADPARANELKQQARLSNIYWNNIIIKNNRDTGYYRVLGFDYCYMSDQDTGRLVAFQAENKLTAAIIQCVAAENITVAFTEGHGEGQNTSRLQEIFSLATFNVEKLNLKNQEISPEVKIIVVNDPVYDFTYDEITAISDYMSDKETYNSLMVFVDADTPDLPNLRDYISEEWGLDYLPNHKITDEEKSLKGSEFSALIGKYSAGTVNNAAYVLHKEASGANLETIFPNAVEIFADTTGLRSEYVEVSAYTHGSAVVTYDEIDESGKLVTKTKTGSVPLLAISAVHSYANDDFNYNANKYQYVILCGSTDFTSGKYLNNSYGNEDIVYSAARVLATDRVQLDIEEKDFASTALTLESGTAKRLMILITCAIPAVIIIVGIAVFFKRRHL